MELPSFSSTGCLLGLYDPTAVEDFWVAFWKDACIGIAWIPPLRIGTVRILSTNSEDQLRRTHLWTARGDNTLIGLGKHSLFPRELIEY